MYIEEVAFYVNTDKARFVRALISVAENGVYEDEKCDGWRQAIKILKEWNGQTCLVELSKLTIEIWNFECFIQCIVDLSCADGIDAVQYAWQATKYVPMVPGDYILGIQFAKAWDKV